MKKKIMSLLFMFCLIMSSFVMSGCNLIDFFDGDNDDITLEDFFAAARNSVAKKEYEIDYTHTTQIMDDGYEPYTYNYIMTKNEDGYFEKYNFENSSYTNSWIKQVNESSEVFYDGYIWVKDFVAADTLGSLTQTEFDEQYDNVSNIIQVIDVSNMVDLIGKAMLDGEVQVEGTYTYELLEEDDNNVLKVNIKDYIVGFNISANNVSYQKITADIKMVFDDGYVTKVTLDYIEDSQMKQEDGTYVGSIRKTSEKSVYDIKYSFNESFAKKAITAYEFMNVVEKTVASKVFTITDTRISEKVAGYDSENGTSTDIIVKSSMSADNHYYSTTDISDDPVPRYPMHFYKISEEAYGGNFYTPEYILSDGVNFTKEYFMEKYGAVDANIPLINNSPYVVYIVNKYGDLSIGNDENEVEAITSYGKIEYSHSFSELSNGDLKLTIEFVDVLLNKSIGYTPNKVTTTHKRSGSIELVYNDQGIKEIVIVANEKEVELSGEEYVETGKVMKHTTKYLISYAFDESIKNNFSE